MTFFKLDYFFPKYNIFLHAVNVYLFADSVLDTNNQFAKVSILVTININLDSHARRVIERNMTIYRIVGQISLRSHSALLFKFDNTKSRMDKLESLNSLYLRSKPEFPLLLF